MKKEGLAKDLEALAKDQACKAIKMERSSMKKATLAKSLEALTKDLAWQAIYMDR
jgi:hypothetical protein